MRRHYTDGIPSNKILRFSGAGLEASSRHFDQSGGFIDASICKNNNGWNGCSTAPSLRHTLALDEINARPRTSVLLFEPGLAHERNTERRRQELGEVFMCSNRILLMMMW